MVKVYVEGGGNTSALLIACRRGFSKFVEKAGLKGNMPTFVACGGRASTYKSFCNAIREHEEAMLLVDSEEAVIAAAQLGNPLSRTDRDQWKPWLHLSQRKGDGWVKPAGAKDLDCHFMVQVTETWFVSDPTTLATYFGNGFKPAALDVANINLELVSKKQIYKRLENATKACKTKSTYGKGAHSFDLLSKIDPAKVLIASPWAQRFIETLQSTTSTTRAIGATKKRT